MKILQRGMFAALLVLLAITPAWVIAQEGETEGETPNVEITIAGSNLALPIIEKLNETTETPLQLTLNGTGNTAGFTQFCAKEVPAIATSRPINDSEKADCAAQETNYTELLIAHHVISIVAHPEDAFVGCVTASVLNQLFTPSTTVSNWQEVREGNPDTPLTVIIPPADDWVNALLEARIAGVGLRATASILDQDSIIMTVSDTNGAIGAVNQALALQNVGKVALIPVDFENGNGCVVATSEAVEAGAYPLSTSYRLYVNTDAQEALKGLLDAVVNSENATRLQTELGYTPISFSRYGFNADIISGDVSADVATQAEATYAIPSVLGGTVTIGGNASFKTSLDTVTQLLASSQTGLTYQTTLLGEVNGKRRFCNGELDLLVTSQPLDAITLEACAANEIVTYTEQVGKKAVVLLANAGDSFNVCLTTEQIQTLWRASNSPITMWNTLGSSFPELATTLFGINAGNEASDILLSATNAPVAPIRQDTELSNDPLYRAAATANVSGALTYMTWSDYQRVLANNQQNIQLVAINNGNGCITPSETTITDGTYPLTLNVLLTTTEEALANDAVRALLWLLFEESNRANLQNAGFTNVDSTQLATARARLLEAYRIAGEAALAREEAAATAEAAESPEVEATAEATETP